MSQSNYDNLVENMYLLSNEANKTHVNKSIDDLNERKFTTLSL